MPEIQRADPRTRRRALAFLLLGVACASLVLWGGRSIWPALQAWVADNPAQAPLRLRLIASSVAAAVVIPALVLAGRFWQLGRRVIRSSRFPPPDMPVVRDTVVWHGLAAHRRGRMLQGVALILTFAVGGFLTVLWRLFALFKGRST